MAGSGRFADALFGVCGMRKRRAGQARKRRNVDARGSQDAVRSPQAASLKPGQPQHPQVLCFPCCSDGLRMASVGALTQMLGSVHGSGASCARVMPNDGCKGCLYSSYEAVCIVKTVCMWLLCVAVLGPKCGVTEHSLSLFYDWARMVEEGSLIRGEGDGG